MIQRFFATQDTGKKIPQHKTANERSHCAA